MSDGCPRALSSRDTRWSTATCGRPLAPGEDVCARHAAADKGRASRAARVAADRAEAAEVIVSRRAQADRLDGFGLSGVVALVDYDTVSRGPRATGRVSVDADELEALLERVVRCEVCGGAGVHDHEAALVGPGLVPSGVRVCLLVGPHDAHDWVYTSEGGGHMINPAYADPLRDRGWHCPGVAGPAPAEAEVVDLVSALRASVEAAKTRRAERAAASRELDERGQW